jgi:hypothetical protein
VPLYFFNKKSPAAQFPKAGPDFIQLFFEGLPLFTPAGEGQKPAFLGIDGSVRNPNSIRNPNKGTPAVPAGACRAMAVTAFFQIHNRAALVNFYRPLESKDRPRLTGEEGGGPSSGPLIILEDAGVGLRETAPNFLPQFPVFRAPGIFDVCVFWRFFFLVCLLGDKQGMKRSM